MKSVSLLSSLTVLSLSRNTEAFSPMSHPSVSNVQTSTSSSLQMGLFDMFQSAEQREENRLRKEREIEEQERLLAQMRERRTNPEKMEEYEVNVVRRRQAYKNTKREWEKLEDKVGESGYMEDKK